MNIISKLIDLALAMTFVCLAATPCSAEDTKHFSQRAKYNDSTVDSVLSEKASEASEETEKADHYANQDKFDDAIGAYKRALQLDPDNAKTREKLAQVYFQTRNLRSAFDENLKALSQAPQSAELHQQRGLIAGVMQNFALAIKEETIAIYLKPNFQLAYAILGKALSSSKRYEEAVSALRKAIALDPNDFDSQITLAAVYGRLSDYNKAINCYQQALALNPKSWLAHFGLGQAYGQLGNNKSQIAELRLAALYGSDNASAHGHLGAALSRIGDLKGAIIEGSIATAMRLGKYGPTAINKFLIGWASVFLFFGLTFAVIFAGSQFKPQAGEQIIKSFVLILYKDRPGRFVLTSRRFVFVPEAFSRWFGATRVSIERDLIIRLFAAKAGHACSLAIDTADGSCLIFKMASLIFAPLMKELENLGYSENFENKSLSDLFPEETNS